MTVSVYDLFSVGIGPSSSHTVGPMRAASRFAKGLGSAPVSARAVSAPAVSAPAVSAPLGSAPVHSVRVELFGSLAATALGHGTIPAIMVGLEGYEPETVSPETIDERMTSIRATSTLLLAGQWEIGFSEDEVIRKPLTVKKQHPNALTLTALTSDGEVVSSRTFFSIGGGFILEEGEPPPVLTADVSPYAFSSAVELLELTTRHGISMSEAMMRYESSAHSRDDVRDRMLHIRDVMVECRERSIERTGTLPGGLGVRRRAGEWRRQLLIDDPDRSDRFAEDWVNLVALAVNEENASGGRVVTAPTNGAAGIIPAVLYYATKYTDAGRADPDDAAARFLLVAGAIGSLYKERASISGAEVGCQGEVGSAASMAAAGLAEVLGGTPQQVENAAEIAMEHSLGLTCDPIGGLVQIPCIERNAISAGKAVNAARMALRGDGVHRVSLDEVIETMRATGADMSSKYKETAMGGLALSVSVNVPEC